MATRKADKSTRTVAHYVHGHIVDSEGNVIDTVALKPGDEVPDGVIVGEHCFEQADDDNTGTDAPAGAE